MAFKGKVVLITGASSGIGAVTAEVFADRGANVILVGRDLQKLQDSDKKCKKVNKEAQTLVVQANVTTDAQRIIDESIKRFGKLDVLVNNAGVYTKKNFMESDLDDLDYVLNTNLRAVHRLTKLAVPYLIESKGNIVNVSSLAGLVSIPAAFNYSISKAALDQFTKCLAQELASKQVRVNSVNPATIETPIFNTVGLNQEQISKYLEFAKSLHPLGRVGQSIDVANAIAYLASEEAGFITGVLLPVDGGRGGHST